MPQSLSMVILHIVFSTKHREPLIFKELRNELNLYIATVCKTCNSIPIKIGCVSDHIHIAASLPRIITVSKLLEEVKKSSSKWIKEKDERLQHFSWQDGYAVFSISQSHLDRLVNYIKNQESHHRDKSFQQELRNHLNHYRIKYDERYVWD
ncbi:MAG: IS200/IS605 family transposase [Fibrobacter sp.]|jgi:putative transposase|nr:IS200/IS605 family transposase [Fibrobacter sp.]